MATCGDDGTVRFTYIQREKKLEVQSNSQITYVKMTAQDCYLRSLNQIKNRIGLFQGAYED